MGKFFLSMIFFKKNVNHERKYFIDFLKIALFTLTTGFIFF